MSSKLILTGVQKLKLNQIYDGTELCPYCNNETDFEFNPMKQTHIVCEHCNEEILPCSLCDHPHGCSCGEDDNHCIDSIKETLINVMEEEEKYD